MNRDFERTDAALASSAAGRTLSFLGRAIESASHTSSAVAAARSLRRAAQAMPAPALLRTIAVAVVIAAALQPLLITAMPATVMPAVPWYAFAVVAIFSAVAAWQAPAILKAWPASMPARVFRR